MTIKRPPPAFDGVTQDNFHVGAVYEVSPNLGILMTAAGWARTETRKQPRRAEQPTEATQNQDRRRLADRRRPPPIQH